MGRADAGCGTPLRVTEVYILSQLSGVKQACVREQWEFRSRGWNFFII